jgi:hypothetical protein
VRNQGLIDSFLSCLVLLPAMIVAGCSGGGDDAAGQPSTGGKATGATPTAREAATAEYGAIAIKSRKCVTCHGADMAGSTVSLGDPAKGTELYPPNLTNHENGIKLWTDDQLATSIRVGFDRDGLQLCPQMKHVADMSDYEVFSIVLHLRSMPVKDTKTLRSVCPPMKTKAEQQSSQ